jgi:zinc protease
MMLPISTVFAVAMLAAQDSEPPKAPTLALESYRLPNGLRVALHRDPEVPRVSVCVAYHVGSKNERAGRTGFAHFFEHMMFRGTKNVSSYDVPLQETGAESNAMTSEDFTIYFETVPSNFLERALYLEAERLAFLPSALNQEKFDTEREVVKNERRESFDNTPYGLSEETILANVFPKGHPYSWSVIGSMTDLNRATLDDLKQFFYEFYHPGNATLCLAGDFDVETARALIAKYFGPLERGPEVQPVTAEAAPAHAKRIELPDRVQLPRLYWSWPTVADAHPDTPALDALATILTGGEASRLHRALVLESRVAKDVAAASDSKDIAGLFTIQSTPVEGKTTADVAAILTKELDRIRAEPPSAAELQRALAYYEKGFYSRLTSPLMRAVTIATGFARENDAAYYRRDFERHFQVKPEEIQRVAKTYLNPEMFVLEIRPAKAGEKAATATDAGPLASSARGPAIVARAPKPGPDWTKMPGPTQPQAFRAPAIIQRKLSTGLDVWIVPWRTLPIVQARMLLPGGTSEDSPEKSGLAYLTATLLTQGTTTKTATELAEAFGILGASPTAAASSDRIVLGFGSVARHFDATLALVGEMLSTPRFEPSDFARERDLQLADLLQGPDDVDWIAGRAFRALLYGQRHPYGQPAEGYPNTLRNLTVEDAHAFHRAHVGPGGATLVLVGDVEPERVLASLEKALAGWKNATSPPPKRPPAASPTEPGVAYFVDKPGAVQSVISVGRPWVDRQDPRYFATLIGNRILGGDFLSRLNRNLRETNGFTYGAGSYFQFRHTGSVWFVRTSVRTDATAPALKEVVAELDGLAGDKPFTAEEISVARGAEAKSYPETFEAPSSIVEIVSEIAEFDLPPDYLETYLERLQAPKPEEISRSMTEVVKPRQRLILIVGDRKSVEPELRRAGFRQIQLVDPNGTIIAR